MGLSRTFIFVFGLSLGLLAACSTAFTYKHYVLNFEEQKLQGPNIADDLPLSICARTNNKFQCITMKMDEFFAMKSDYERMFEQLKACQEGTNAF